MAIILQLEKVVFKKQLIDCITHYYKEGENFMMIFKIAITIIAAVLALPIQYIFFPKLVRPEREMDEEIEIFLKMEIIVGLVEMIAIVLISIGISYLCLWKKPCGLLCMAYPIFWQFIWACTSLQKRLLPVVLPILIIAFIGCILPIIN